MKPVANFDNFPSFGNAGTRNAPGDAKYSLGFVPADTLPAEWANYFFHGSTKGITDLNSAVRSIWSELENILTAYGVTPNADSTEQILSVLNKIYPSFTSCSTAASEQTKSIAITGNILKAGNLYVIDMTNANSYGDGTATYPMLSINSGTAYPICDSCGNYAKVGAWKAGQTVKMLFTGTKFLMSAGITNTVQSGDMNAPTSNAVATAIAGIGASIIGEIKIWPGVTVPSNQWMICNGAELSRTEYAALFSILGVTWGNGDGVNTFNIPDLRGEFIRGAGTNSHANQGSGGSVGTHQDATTMPYTYGNANANNISFTTNGTIINVDGYGASSNTYITIESPYQGQSSSYNWANVRPTNTSVNFIIRVQ